MEEERAASTKPVSSTPGTDNATVLALLLGITGIVFCPLLGVAAWYYSNVLLRQIKNQKLPPSNYNLALLAKVLGIIGTIIMIGTLIVMILAFAGIIGTAVIHSSSG